MPLEVFRLSFYLVTLKCRCSGDLISVRGVMPLTLASPAPSPGSCLPSPQFHHAGVGRSLLLLRWEPLPAMLCCACKARTHTPAVLLLPSHGPARSMVCPATAPSEHGVPSHGPLGARCASPAGWQVAAAAGQISLAYGFVGWQRGCDAPLSACAVPGRGWRSARRGAQAPQRSTGCV